jgi:7-cyano-7-deazaguanine synthase
MQKKAIILFSGGLDSTTCLGLAKAQGFSCYALSFIYGQKHQVEIEYAKKIAAAAGVIQHKILNLPLGELGGSSLTDTASLVPDFQDHEAIPTTYVPARNTIFLSFALAWGEVIDGYDIFIGANHLDYSGYPDCRPDYLQAFEEMAMLGTKIGREGRSFKIHAPLLQMHKSQIIRAGIALDVDYSQTISCYRINTKGQACGNCDSCVYRKKGFAEAGVQDPTHYCK